MNNKNYAVKVLKPYETRGCNPLFVKAMAGCKLNHNYGLAEKLHNPCKAGQILASRKDFLLVSSKLSSGKRSQINSARCARYLCIDLFFGGSFQKSSFQASNQSKLLFVRFVQE